MYSDTHFHFKLIVEEHGVDGTALLSSMADRGCMFGQDIGTEYDDLPLRQQCICNAIATLPSADRKKAVEQFMWFATGIWPSPDEIRFRKDRFPVFMKNLETALGTSDPFLRKVSAIGECGLDHHWNSSGADCRKEEDFDSELRKGEHDLFCMQLDLARKLNLPVIVHSRDAAEETMDCIKECGYDKGVIHCFSYGIDEAEAFLNRGWYISLSGSVTYTKKSKMEEMNKLIRAIPSDKLLIETDAPYLAPVPCRGQSNTPLLIEHTYKFVAGIRNISVEELCSTVDENSRVLFGFR